MTYDRNTQFKPTTMRNLLLVLSLIPLLSFQESTIPELSNYFGISGQKYDRDGEERVSIYPIVKNYTEDATGRFISRHSRRFEYLLVNRVDVKNQVQTYKKMFPDTVKISKMYADHLAQSDSFLTYLNTFLAPMQEPANQQEIVYSEAELMDVASKFFFCDRVRPDSTIGMHVCIGLNGVKEAKWSKDYTLLEAFCFEAIFENLFNDNDEDDGFMDSSSAYKKNSSQAHLKQSKNLDEYLEKVKLEVFDQMAHDESLREALLTHYQENAENLPFKIK